MLTGDDLSTQYFIAGAAITVLGIGVTQAGWTHRWFVRTMFLLGLALLASAALWGQVTEQFPKIAKLTNPIGSSTLAWLSLLFGALTSVLYLDYRARTRKPLEGASGHVPSPPAPDARAPIYRNVSEIQLVPSGEEMALVVTPCRGQTTVQMFVDLSSWFPSHGWSQTARYYLGEMPLRSANVKFSLSVLGRAPDGIVGWFWKTLASDGTPSESRPWFIQGRQRAIFVFIDATGTQDEFPLLLLQPDPSTKAHPVVITPDDLPIKTAS
jgi:hypothetical protein